MEQDSWQRVARRVWSSPVFRVILTIGVFAAGFCVLQRLTFLLRFPPIQRTTIWTPGALLLSALLLVPSRQWWIYFIALFIGAFAAYFGDSVIPIVAALLAAQTHFAAVALSAWGIRRFSNNTLFGGIRSLLVFVVFATLVIPVITTAPIELARWYSGANDVLPIAVRSVLCVALGMLVATPALTLTWENGGTWFRTGSMQRLAEIAGLGLGLVVVGHFAFGSGSGSEWQPALLYAPMPMLLWAAVRFELAGVSWALLVVAVQSTWNAVHGRGPFVSESPADNVLQIQLLLLATSVPLMFLAVVIQERRHAYSALFETQRGLEHVSRLAIVGELTASIAHEISQPLGAILSNTDAAEMLLDSAPDSLTEVRQILGDIRQDDLRANEIIRRLRGLLRKREIEMLPVQLGDITSEVLALIRADAKRRGVAVEVELAVDLPLVLGDRIHLQQVLLNLFLNGLESMAENQGAGRLHVRTQLNLQGLVETTVSDTGPGLLPDQLKRLFEPFYSTKKEGLGLGLSIVRSLVEAHGGRIWAENNPDRGATFRFVLPVVRPQSPQDSPP